MKILKEFCRWLLHTRASGELRYARAQQAGRQAGEREANWHGDPFGKMMGADPILGVGSFLRLLFGKL